MKNILKILPLLLLLAFMMPDGKKVPSVQIQTLDGRNVNTSTFSNGGKPMLISFWATWCSPCKKEIGVKLIAISIDDSRNSNKVAPYVNGKGWEYEEYLDINSDFKRALGVN